MKDEVKALTPDDRQYLLEDMKFKIEIPTLTGLAMKADLCLSWKTVRSMRRYTVQN